MKAKPALRLSLCALWLACIALLGVLYVHIPPSPDLQIFDYIGWVATNGGTPYVDATEQNWPGAIWLHTASVALFGTTLSSFRTFDYLLMVLLGTLSLRQLLRDLPLPFAGSIVALLYPAMYVSTGDWWTTGQRDIVAAHILLVICCAFSLRMRGRSRAWLAVVGALMLFVVLTRPTYLLFAPFLFGADVMSRRDTGRNVRVIAIDAALAAAVFTGCLGLLIGYAAHTGALTAFKASAIDFNTQVYGATRTYLEVTKHLLGLVRSWHWYLAFSCVSAVLWWRSGERRVFGLLCALTLTSIGSAYAQRKGFGYHVAALLPVMAALIATLVARVIAAAREQRTPLRVGFAVLIVVFTLGGLGKKLRNGLRPQYLYLSGQLSYGEMLRQSETEVIGHSLTDAVHASEYVARRTKQDDTVLVWGRRVLVNTLAQRRSPTRFVTAGMLELANPPFTHARAWNDELRRALEGPHPPAVVLAPGHDHPEHARMFEAPDAPEALLTLRKALARRYRRDSSFGDMDAYVLAGEPASASSRITLTPHTTLVLLDEREAGRRIATKDAFVLGLSALDRELRVGRTGEVTDHELLSYFAEQVRPFRPAQRERLREAANALARALVREGLSAALPGEIPIALTSGREEASGSAGVSYTREGVIYLSEHALDEAPTFLLAHELFHVYSHHHPNERAELYRRTGFLPLGHAVEWPASIEARRVSAPECPRTEHAIRVRHRGQEVLAAQVTLYDPSLARVGDLSSSVTSRYALLDPTRPEPFRAPEGTSIESEYVLDGFFEQVGENTGYLAGPEEIWADNFQLLLMAKERAKTPALLDNLRSLMRGR